MAPIWFPCPRPVFYTIERSGYQHWEIKRLYEKSDGEVTHWTQRDCRDFNVNLW